MTMCFLKNRKIDKWIELTDSLGSIKVWEKIESIEAKSKWTQLAAEATSCKFLKDADGLGKKNLFSSAFTKSLSEPKFSGFELHRALLFDWHWIEKKNFVIPYWENIFLAFQYTMVKPQRALKMFAGFGQISAKIVPSSIFDLEWASPA